MGLIEGYGGAPPLVLCAKENVWRLALNERLQEKAQGFLGLWGKAAYEHTEFLVLLVGVGRFWSFQALGEQVVPFDFIVPVSYTHLTLPTICSV